MSKCFKIQFHEDWVWKLNQKIKFFVPSNGHKNCLDKWVNKFLNLDIWGKILCKKSRFKKCNRCDTLKSAKKVDLASLKSKLTNYILVN